MAMITPARCVSFRPTDGVAVAVMAVATVVISRAKASDLARVWRSRRASRAVANRGEVEKSEEAMPTGMRERDSKRRRIETAPARPRRERKMRRRRVGREERVWRGNATMRRAAKMVWIDPRKITGTRGDTE